MAAISFDHYNRLTEQDAQQRIDSQHLAWTLENLADGKMANRIAVPPHEAILAKAALDRMLDVS